MQQHTVLLLSFLLASTLVVRQTLARCGVCTDHGIACINATSFQICSNGVANANQVFSCPEPLVCTDSESKCNDPIQVNPFCDPEDTNCGICSMSKIFACTSRSTFVQCNGSQLMKQVNRCPQGLICDSRGSEICVDECKISKALDCNFEPPAL